ncbi:MAG: ATP-dependent helicase [Candidatus Coatesbacteria bacterium]|nr:MAG: ATP-dependent helicase [Candidatus Coatesbacteria bacterium]
MAMSIRPFLDRILASADESRYVAARREVPPRTARYADIEPPLPEELRLALSTIGIERLYAHQVRALELARGGADIVVVSRTASGKSLCYDLPVLESLLEDASRTAIYMFPTKALSYDQQAVLERLWSQPSFQKRVLSGVYDGDTNSYRRKKVRDRANILITNPDMLHVGILPHHSRWARLFANLSFVVLDEIHTYRGIFGSNVANVLRRLVRVCDYVGARPQFICCSATIGNPVELAERLTDRKVMLVDEDAAPQSRKHFVIWNPPPESTDSGSVPRSGMMGEARRLVARLVSSGIQTIAFTRTRMGAEVLCKNIKEDLTEKKEELARRVKPYRGGYLPQQRRQIEKGLSQRKVLAVISTTALQLGIDIGSLDACVMVGYPGTIAAMWQQAGRAGRKQSESLVILVAGPDPVDQYIAHNPDYLFGKSPEKAVIDPDNPYILSQQISCAAVERPLTPEDEAYFGPQFAEIVKILKKESHLRQIGQTWYWSSEEQPFLDVSLRTVTSEKLVIHVWDGQHRGQVIGEIDASSAPFIAHPEAIYIHDGETFRVTHLDYENASVVVERADVAYYTTPITSHAIRITNMLEERDFGSFRAGQCSVNVTTRTAGYAKRLFSTGAILGTKELALDAVVLDTTAAYIIVSREVRDALSLEGLSALGGLVGLKNLISVVGHLVAMCDRHDIGVVLDSDNFEAQAIFVFDRYEGGLGFAEKIAEVIEDVLSMCYSVICACPCENGCPSCVGTAGTERLAVGKLSGRVTVPRKGATRRLLELVLEG